MSAPYRTSLPRVVGADVALHECWFRDGDRGRWIRALYVKGWITLTVSAALVAWKVWPAALVTLLFGFVWTWRDIQGRNGSSVVFTIRSGRLRISRGGGARGDEPLVIELAELHDVRLDTKSTSKNLTMARADGVNSVFGAASSHNIEIDVSRIELVLEGGEHALLSPDYINASLCMETMRSIRLFLRAEGWTPFDERRAGGAIAPDATGDRGEDPTTDPSV